MRALSRSITIATACSCLVAPVALGDAPPGFEHLIDERLPGGFSTSCIAVTESGVAICGGGKSNLSPGFIGQLSLVDPGDRLGPPIVLGNYNRRVSDVAISPDGTLMAAATFGREAEIFETETWKSIGTIPSENGGTTGTFSHDGTSLYLCDGTIRAFTIEQLQVTSELFPPESLYSHVAVGSDDQSVLLVERSGRVEVWDNRLASRSQETPRVPRDSRCHVEAIAVNPKSGCIAVGCTDGHIDVWNEPLTECVASLALPPPRSETGDLYSLDFIDEDTLIVSSNFGRICVFDIDERSEVWSKQLGPLGGYAVVAVSRGGEYIGIGSIWGTIAIYGRTDVEQSD